MASRNDRIRPQRRRPSARILLGVAAFAVVLTTGVAWSSLRGASSHSGAEEQPLTVTITPLDQETGYVRRHFYVGQIEAARESDVGFESPGRVTEVLADEGDAVDRGQPLAQLDVVRLQARRAELQASLEEIAARRRLAQITLERTRGLVQRHAASRQKLDDDREGLQALLAAEQLAKARLESNAVDLHKAVLRAPYDAVVTRRFVDEGRVLPIGTPVLRLLERAAPEARVGIAGQLAERLAPDRGYRLEVHGVEVAARVKAVLPVRDSSKRTVDAIFSLEQFDASLRSGDLVRLTLPEHVETSGFWLSLSALTAGPRGLWSVYVADPSAGARSDATYRVQARIVEILHAEGDRVYVRGDLESGDLLVSDGVHRVVAGQLVRLTASGDLRAKSDWTRP